MSKKKLFDSERKTLSDRLDHVENLIENNDLSSRDLERLGTYLLESKDIKSDREIEYRFIRKKSREKIWREYSSCRLNESDINKRSRENRIDEFIGFDSHWIQKIFNLGNLSPDEQIKLVKSYHHFRNNDIQEQLLEHLYYSLQVIFNKVRDGIDLVILNLVAYENTQADISKKISIEQSNISRRLKRITESF